MEQLLTDNVWEQIGEFLDPNLRKRAAIAYVSSERYLDFSKGDVLVCDASDQAIGCGETSASVLKRFWEQGVELYSLPNLHAKVVVFGDQDYVLVGSANLSVSSAESLRELVLLSDASQIISQAVAFIHILKRSAIPIDAGFISRISEIKVKRALAPKTGRKPLRKLGHRKWIVSVKELRDSAFRDESGYVDKAFDELESDVSGRVPEGDIYVGWLRFTGRSRFRREATEGDIAIVIFKYLGGNIEVFRPTPILLRQDQDRWTRFYYELPPDTGVFDWESVKEGLDKLGLAHITENSVRELKVEEFAAVEELLGSG